jgi:hypothetical protein
MFFSHRQKRKSRKPDISGAYFQVPHADFLQIIAFYTLFSPKEKRENFRQKRQRPGKTDGFQAAGAIKVEQNKNSLLLQTPQKAVFQTDPPRIFL